MSPEVLVRPSAAPAQKPGGPAPGRSLRLLAMAILAATGLTAFYMLGAGGMQLVEPDEPRCALIVRHMIQSGDYLAPQLLGRPYFDKPPLFFWMLAASVKAFGESEWSLRLPPALIAAVTVVLTGLLAGQLFGRRAAWIAGAAFAVSVAAVIAARVVRMDMLLVLWITGTLLCWSHAFLLSPSPRSEAPGPAAQSGNGWPSGVVLLMYLCMALGCLTKGPIAVALPALVIGVYLLLSRPLRDIPRDLLAMRPFLGLLILLVIYGFWVACMTWRYPEYPAEFFGRQNLDRFAGSGLDASEPPWVILGTFVGGLTPWIPLAGMACWLHRPRRNMPAAEKFAWIWGLTVLVIFTISKARMPNYVLPAFPPTFALLGACLAGPLERNHRLLAVNLCSSFVLLAAALVSAAITAQIRLGELNYLLPGIALGVLGLLAVLAWWLWRRGPAQAILPLLLAGALTGIGVTLGPAQAYCASRSTRVLADAVARLDPAIADRIPIATHPRYGVFFYAPPAWRARLHHVDNSEVKNLLPLLNTARQPIYAILTGGGILRQLEQDNVVGVRVSDRLTVLQRCDADALVRVDPAAGFEASGSSPQEGRDDQARQQPTGLQRQRQVGQAAKTVGTAATGSPAPAGS